MARRLKLKNRRAKKLSGGVQKNTNPPLGLAPGIVGPAIGAVGDVVGAFTGGETVPGVTKEDLEQAEQTAREQEKKAVGEFDREVNVGGSTNVTGDSKKQLAEAALTQALIEKNGLSEEEALAEARKRLAKKAPQDIRVLKQFLRQNPDEYGLNVNRRGQVKRTSPRETTIESPRDEATEMQADFTEDVFDSSSELLPEFTDDARAGLDFRSNVRNILSDQFVDQGLDAQLDADIDRIMELNTDLNRANFSELQNTGFLNSTITGPAYERNVQRGLRKAFTDMQSNRNNLRSQNTRDILAAEAQLSGPRTIGEFQSGAFVAPGQFGGFSDPESEAARFRRQEGKANQRNNSANRLATIGTTQYV